MHFANLVHAAGVIEDALGSRRLACVDMSGDTNVANFRKITRHRNSSIQNSLFSSKHKTRRAFNPKALRVDRLRIFL
jgi:hypothetical protein